MNNFAFLERQSLSSIWMLLLALLVSLNVSCAPTEPEQPPKVKELWNKTIAKERTVVCDFSPDGSKTAILNTETGKLSVLATRTGEVLWQISEQEIGGSINHAVFDRTGTKLVVGDDDKLLIHLFHSENGERIAQTSIPCKLSRPTFDRIGNENALFFMGPMGTLDVYQVDLDDLKCTRIVDSGKLFPTLKEERVADVRVNLRERGLFVVGDHILLTLDSFLFDVSKTQPDQFRKIMEVDISTVQILNAQEGQNITLMRSEAPYLQSISLQSGKVVQENDLSLGRAAAYKEFAVQGNLIVAIETEHEGAPTELIFANMETGTTVKRLKLTDDYFLPFESRFSLDGRYLIHASKTGELTCYEIEW